jgi:endonuclease YncB( thermonuclease family)
MKKIFVVLLAVSACSAPKQPLELVRALPSLYPEHWVPAIVTSAHDGDTFRARLTGGRTVPVRILGMDSPEVKSSAVREAQPHGEEARTALREMVLGKMILLDTASIRGKNQYDPYGRLLANVYRLDTIPVQAGLSGGSRVDYVLLSAALISKGMAWHYPANNRRDRSKNEGEYRAQCKAEKAKLGLWKTGKQIKPKEWRKKHRN